MVDPILRVVDASTGMVDMTKVSVDASTDMVDPILSLVDVSTDMVDPILISVDVSADVADLMKSKEIDLEAQTREESPDFKILQVPGAAAVKSGTTETVRN